MTVALDPVEVARWSGGDWTSPPLSPLTGVIHDTHAVWPGVLFAALRGTRVDGHEFIGTAAEKGAAAALVSRSKAAGAARFGLPLLRVDDVERALGQLATGYRKQLGIPVVGVTGSTGKTTVKEMIACLLGSVMPTARTKGNWNNEIGLPLSILAISGETHAAVLELGISHPGEMAPLCVIAQPDWGVITNVGPVHLEFFKSVEAIAREKGELFRRLPPTGTAVVSRDDPHWPLLRDLATCRMVTISTQGHPEADYVLSPDGSLVRERSSGESTPLHLTVPGRHNRHNALLAIATARGFGLSWDHIASAFATYVPPPMRWEQVDIDGVTVINDAYNANPVSMAAALQTFGEVESPGRKWLVLGDMLELGAGEVEAHRDIGRSLADGPWAGLIAVGVLGARIAEGAAEAGLPPDCIRTCPDAEAATVLLKDLISRGDAVLLKASRGRRLEVVVGGLKGLARKD